jgi:hypothetical protein
MQGRSSPELGVGVGYGLAGTDGLIYAPLFALWHLGAVRGQRRSSPQFGFFVGWRRFASFTPPSGSH